MFLFQLYIIVKLFFEISSILTCLSSLSFKWMVPRYSPPFNRQFIYGSNTRSFHLCFGHARASSIGFQLRESPKQAIVMDSAPLSQNQHHNQPRPPAIFDSPIFNSAFFSFSFSPLIVCWRVLVLSVWPDHSFHCKDLIKQLAVLQ